MEKYPDILLPRKIYKYIDCDLSAFYLLRTVKIDPDIDLLNELGEINVEYICSPRANIYDLSTSLLSHFDVDHVQISLTKNGKASFSHECEPNYEGVTPVFEEDFTKDIELKYWVVMGSDISNLKIDFEFSETPYTAVSYIIHTPMRWNFWHYSVRWKINGLDLEDLSFNSNQIKAIYSKIGAKARAQISQSAIISIEIYPKLDEVCFISTPTI